MKLPRELIKLLALIANGDVQGRNFDKNGTSYRKSGDQRFSGRHEGKSISGNLDRNGTGSVYFEGKTHYYDHGYETKRLMKPSK